MDVAVQTNSVRVTLLIRITIYLLITVVPFAEWNFYLDLKITNSATMIVKRINPAPA
jgi:hypothetical protein